MIKFKTVRWKNLLSTGNNFTEVLLNANKSTILLGPSGSGKSTLLDAISFALFNKPFRNINKNQLINTINQKNCLVEIEFDIGNQNYLVRRGMKPTLFEIYCNNTLLNQDSHTKDYQQYLEKSILKFNFKAFSQIVVLGASNFTPFMQLKPSDRRIIIEGLLDIEIFSVMNVLLKQKLSTLKNNLQELEYSISLNKEKIALHNKYIENLSKDKDEKIQENVKLLQKNVQQADNITTQNNSLQQTVLTLKDKVNFKEDVINQITTIKNIKSKLTTNISRTEKEICFYTENNNCPTCKQHIQEEFKQTEINTKTNKIKEWSVGITDAEKALDKFLSKLEEAKVIEEELNGIQRSIVKNENTIDSINQYIKKIENDIKELQKEKDSPNEYNQILDSLCLEKDKLEKNKQTFFNQRELYEVISSLLKDDGVKAKIIKQYLPIINKHTNLFLNAMNFFVSFNIDEEFNENIKSRGRDEFAYENFSEGEKQRIDLALLFTWRTIAKLKNSVNTNLLIMDEILDSYLDTAATENVLHLLNSEMFKDTNMFVISHKENISEKFQKTIRFTKNKNFSIISEYV